MVLLMMLLIMMMMIMLKYDDDTRSTVYMIGSKQYTMIDYLIINELKKIIEE
jgi:hypothetical protein